MSAAVQTTFPPGPGTNCTDLSFADLSKQLEEDLHTTATATLVSAVISTLGSLYVLLFAALRCRERRQKQRRSGLKQRWSEWCAMHSTTVIVLNVTVSCLCISLLLITEVRGEACNGGTVVLLPRNNDSVLPLPFPSRCWWLVCLKIRSLLGHFPIFQIVTSGRSKRGGRVLSLRFLSSCSNGQ